MPENTNFQLRSEEVQDILTKVPNWMIRWGTVLIFGIVLMLFFMSWFIKYPDVVSAEIIITTNIPPEKLVAKTSGKIQSILVKNKSIVSQNKPLAIIENSANYQDVFKLKAIIEKTSINSLNRNFPFAILNNLQL